jgi:acid phosphatase
MDMSKPSLSGASRVRWLVSAVVLFAAGCAGSSQSVVEIEPVVASNDGLNSTLWSLTAAEYDATVLSLYGAAEYALTGGLADTGWTALIEQVGQEDYADLPPAVVLDVDETVLDNGAYQAGLVLDDTYYSGDTWLEWVLQERAAPIPGALGFCRRAAAMGITVIYLTNRRANMEEATRRNLIDLGFPVDPAFDVVLTRGERPEWEGGEKSSRRRFVAEHYRVIALLGDNLGDFLDIDGLSLEARDYEVAATHSMWGSRWFMMPNPQYGSWESTLFDRQYRLSPSERRRLKRSHLDEKR